MRTVVGNEALVTFVADKVPGANVYGLNPGLIRTEIRDGYLGKDTWFSYAVESLIGLFCQSAETFAEKTLLPLMVAPELDSANKMLIDSDGTLLPANPFLAQTENYDRVIMESVALIDRAKAAKI
jgi:hypothetical protein